MTSRSVGSRRTKTSAFGTNGRINHDSSAFYNARLYDGRKPIGSNVAYVENVVPAAALDRVFLKSAESMSELPDCSIHLMVTSPPYNVGKEYDRDLSEDDYRALLRRVLEETKRVLVPGGRACINVANLGRKPYLPVHGWVIQDALALGFLMRGEIIWDKAESSSPSTAWGSWQSAADPILRDSHEYILVFSKDSFARSRVPDRADDIGRDDFLEFTKSVWVFPAESATRVDHPAPFPEELPWRVIKLLTFKGEIVLDPFMGSGTTAVAALRADRHFVGYETDPHYLETAVVRIQQAQVSIWPDRSTRPSAAASPIALPVPTSRTNGVVSAIVAKSYLTHIEGKLPTDDSLDSYFDTCFDEIIERFDLYPSWTCQACLRAQEPTAAIGVPPERCPRCGSARVFENASFQSRASLIGKVFAEAVRSLVSHQFDVALNKAHRTEKTHDFELGDLAVAARGSLRRIILPDGTKVPLLGPGMKRSDTQKKVTANAQAFLEKHPSHRFIVVTNAVRGDPVTTSASGDFEILDLSTVTGLDALGKAVDQRPN